jgi:ATP-dependent helicase/nuclease subunit A
VRELLSFVNDVFADVAKVPDRRDAFRYGDDDRFPVLSVEASERAALGMAVAPSEEAQAEAVAEEISALLVRGATVRDRETGVRRALRPGDIGVLFRTRDGHRTFEEALARRHVPYYVYKGLGFFDADEIKDVLALLAFLASPASELRAAAFLRSRFVGLSDVALKHLAPALSAALLDAVPPAATEWLDAHDRQFLLLARRDVPRWVAMVDNLPPAELLDRVLAESAYAVEMRGQVLRQARENLKKLRSLVRRIQNRGYATLDRIVSYFTELAACGDESNAIVDAVDAVNLMTVHAAKGLEFPIVFVVNLSRGSGGSGDAIRIVARDDDAAVSIGEYHSEADRDLEAKETEEAKRLLYVALTRARDRLYFATTINQDGKFVAPKGSLGKLLPASLGDVLTQAAAPDAPPVLAWTGPSGMHEFKILRASGVVEIFEDPLREDGPWLDDFAPLTATD